MPICQDGKGIVLRQGKEQNTDTRTEAFERYNLHRVTVGDAACAVVLQTPAESGSQRVAM